MGIVPGGHEDVFGKTAIEVYKLLREPHGGFLPEKMLPVCTWGCGIYTCVNCADPKAAVSFGSFGDHVTESNDVTATLTDSNGNVIANFGGNPKDPMTAQPQRPVTMASMTLHKNTFEEYMLAWANGIDLWGEMQS